MSLILMKQRVRYAVTLVEVIFAIGVILIGLLGLLSILPLAGKRAQDAISLSVGPIIAANVEAELRSQKFLGNKRLAAITFGTIPPLAEPNPATPGGPMPEFPKAFPEGYYQDTLEYTSPDDVTPSFCIDPMFASATSAPDGASTPNGYYSGCFPYYKQTHDPMQDPSTDQSTNWGSRQPRMFRVGITAESDSIDKYFVNLSEALRLTENQDDILVTRPTDKSIPARLTDGLIQPVVDGLEYGKRIPSGEFSWIATVNPLPGGVYASVSVVVIRKRTREFNAPTGTTAPDSAEGNAIGERIAEVTYANGFKGGSGGMVHLASNANTSPRLRSGDWVMLSRFVRDGASGVIDYHRWYRVVNVDGEEERFPSGTVYTPNGVTPTQSFTGDVWRRKVMLDGPDWEFGYRSNFTSTNKPPYADTPDANPYATSNSDVYATWTPYIVADRSGIPAVLPFSNNTYATIVEGVVSVTERTVLLSDL